MKAELSSSNAYFPLTTFLSSPKSVYDPGWLPLRIASFVAGKPIWWALQQLNVVSSEDNAFGHASDGERWNKVKGDYVVLSLLETAAENVIQKRRDKAGVSLADSLHNMESFRNEFACHALEGAVLSDLDLKVLVRYLERDKKVLVTQQGTIKFIGEDGTQVPEITAIDAGVLEMKTAVDKLQAQVESIQDKLDERSRRISAALRQKRKEVALSHLRARKQLEDLLGKRLRSLDTLQSTLIRVEASAGDVEIMKSYESSTATLRAILAHPSLQREKIDETLDAMAAANADAQDIDDAIRMGTDVAQANVGIDESALEEELNALVRADEEERTKNDRAKKARNEVETTQETQEKLASGDLHAPSHVPELPNTESMQGLEASLQEIEGQPAR
ncbi:hypothetical protein AcW1_005659 [Taiwanofungus camphoratus]|nr:hypothetical protein AcW2_004423 [Antrodia cinnamomea]KAI0957187.1 hypothetical protein AcW1_005659 [Antrodia cinnamomea]